MSRYHSYLNSAVSILNEYNGQEPFAAFLKKYFALHKKYGSKDRKNVSHLCYCYFRLGKASQELPVGERILLALFLCSSTPNEILEALDPDRNKEVALPITDKLRIAGFSAAYIFPWADQLSEGVDEKLFAASHLQQPDLFLRIRPGKAIKVKEKLTEAGINFHSIGEQSLALSNASKVDELLEIDRDVVVQDLSSQQTGLFLKSHIQDMNTEVSVWDCCAASGGKSIMLMDMLRHAELTVSDIRKSIILNLEKRFERAGIKEYNSFTIDLSEPEVLVPGNFDLVLADVPCSGSGTWGRTPEQLFYFEEQRIGEYASLQKKIITKVVQAVKPGGKLLYITCSVFKKENEGLVNFIKEKFHLELIRMELIKGYDSKADTMFVALFRNPL